MLKKLMAVVLVGLLTIGSMAIMTTAAEPVTSLFFDFEDQEMEGENGAPTGWSTYSDAERISINTEQTADMPARLGLGDKCLEIDCTGDETDIAATYFSATLKPNTTYVLSAWVKGIGEGYVYGRIPMIAPGETNYNGTYLTRAWSASSYAGSQKWQRLVSSPYTTGDEAITTTIWVRGFQGYKICYDNIALFEVNATEANATYPTQNEPTIVVDEAAVPNPYYINGGFEEFAFKGTVAPYQADGWTYGHESLDDETTAKYAVVTNEKARTGQYSLKISSTDAYHARQGLYKEISGLTPGKTYKVSSYVNFVGNSYLGIFVGVKATGAGAGWTDSLTITGAGSNSVGQSSHSPVQYDTENKWKPCAAYFVANAETATLTIQGCSNYYDDGSVAYVDDISITEVPSTGIDVNILGADGQEISGLVAGQQNKVKIFVSGINSLADAKKYTLAYATYTKDGEVTEMKTVGLSQSIIDACAEGKSYAFLREEIDVTVEAGQILNVFLFDDISKLSVASSYTLS